MFIYFNPDGISRFYKTQRFMEFSFLTKQRINEINIIAQNNKESLLNDAPALGTLMSLCAEKLTSSPLDFGLQNSDEILYFYMQVIDPEFLFLEVYESANKKRDIEPLCLQNFGIYDPFLIYYEVMFKRRFDPDFLKDLWSRGKVQPLNDEHSIAK